MGKLFLVLGSLNMFISVALGAFGAHALKDRIEEKMLTVWNTGVHYHMIHAIGLIIVGLAVDRLQAAEGAFRLAGWLLFAGVVLFSGSLYALSLSGVRVLGAITPLGGIAFLAGWLVFAYAVYKAY